MTASWDHGKYKTTVDIKVGAAYTPTYTSAI